MRKLSWIAQSGDLLINSKRLRQQREVVGGKEAEKRNKSFPSSSHCRLTFPILNTTHLSRRFDKFTSMEIKLKTTIAKFSFMKSKGTKSIENRKNKNKIKKPGGIFEASYMRINGHVKSLLSFHLTVVEFRVLLGSSSRKYTGSFTTDGTLVYLLSYKDQSICFLWRCCYEVSQGPPVAQSR